MQMGWRKGQGLGRQSQGVSVPCAGRSPAQAVFGLNKTLLPAPGRVDPIPFEEKQDSMGLGRWQMEVRRGRAAPRRAAPAQASPRSRLAACGFLFTFSLTSGGDCDQGDRIAAAAGHGGGADGGAAGEKAGQGGARRRD